MKKGVGFISQRYGSGDPDPDPHQNVTDPQLWLLHHRVHIHEEYHSVCARVGIGTPPTPLSRQPVCPSSRNQMGGWGGPETDVAF